MAAENCDCNLFAHTQRHPELLREKSRCPKNTSMYWALDHTSLQNLVGILNRAGIWVQHPAWSKYTLEVWSFYKRWSRFFLQKFIFPPVQLNIPCNCRYYFWISANFKILPLRTDSWPCRVRSILNLHKTGRNRAKASLPPPPIGFIFVLYTVCCNGYIK